MIFDRRNRLSTFVSHQCSESRYAKNGGTATRLRDEGNAKFRAHDNEGSLKVYTESIICSPEFGPELCLGFGNRSASLYHSGHYEDCLQDIDLALNNRYPKNLEYKLYQRRGQCQTKLGNFAEAKVAFEAAIEALEKVPKLTAEKKESMIKDIHALMTEAKTSSERKDEIESQPQPQPEAPTVPTYGPNNALPGGSSCLEVKTTTSKGRHVVTQKSVKVGDVLFSELPYASVLLPDHYSSHCHHCVRFKF